MRTRKMGRRWYIFRLSVEHMKLNPRDFGLPPLADEIDPDETPFPGLAINIPDPNAKRSAAEQIYIGTYLASSLLRSAVRLAELAEKHQGRFLEGLEMPETGKAAAAGAIAVACAALEASLNDMLLTADLLKSDGGPSPEERLIRLTISLPVDRRLEAMAAICGRPIDWSREPYQSLNLLLSVRKHLLHHEGGLIKAAEGFWPAKKLGEVARKLQSPYPVDDPVPLPWYVHVLNPKGAAWAVTVIAPVLEELEEMQDDLETRLGLRDQGNDT